MKKVIKWLIVQASQTILSVLWTKVQGIVTRNIRKL